MLNVFNVNFVIMLYNFLCIFKFDVLFDKILSNLYILNIYDNNDLLVINI